MDPHHRRGGSLLLSRRRPVIRLLLLFLFVWLSVCHLCTTAIAEPSSSNPSFEVAGEEEDDEEEVEAARLTAELNCVRASGYVEDATLMRIFGRHDDALVKLLDAQAICNSSAEVHFRLGDVYLVKDALILAEESYNRALLLDPHRCVHEWNIIRQWRALHDAKTIQASVRAAAAAQGATNVPLSSATVTTTTTMTTVATLSLPTLQEKIAASQPGGWRELVGGLPRLRGDETSMHLLWPTPIWRTSYIITPSNRRDALLNKLTQLVATVSSVRGRNSVTSWQSPLNTFIELFGLVKCITLDSDSSSPSLSCTSSTPTTATANNAGLSFGNRTLGGNTCGNIALNPSATAPSIIRTLGERRGAAAVSRQIYMDILSQIGCLLAERATSDTQVIQWNVMDGWISVDGPNDSHSPYTHGARVHNYSAAASEPWSGEGSVNAYDDFTVNYIISNGNGHADDADFSASDPRVQASVLTPSSGWFQYDMPLRLHLQSGTLLMYPSWLRRNIWPSRTQSGQARVMVTLHIRVFTHLSSVWHMLTHHSPPDDAEKGETVVVEATPTGNDVVASTSTAVDGAQGSITIGGVLSNQRALHYTAALADSPTFTLRWATPIMVHRAPLPLPVATTILHTELRTLFDSLMKTHPGQRRSNKGGWQSPADLFDSSGSHPAIQHLRSYVYGMIGRYYDTLSRHSYLVRFPLSDETPLKRGDLQITITWSWACTNHVGHFNSPHTHPDAMISGVYYLTTGYDHTNMSDAAGLRLMDPTPRASQPCVALEEESQNLRARPKNGATPAATAASICDNDVHIGIAPGTMVLFPSWLEHYVLPQPKPHKSSSSSGNENPAATNVDDGTRIAVSFNARVRHVDDRTRIPPLRMMIPVAHAPALHQYDIFDN